MPYVDKVGNEVVGVYALPQRKSQEFLQDDDPLIVEFRKESKEVRRKRREAELGMTHDAMLEALWEKEITGMTTKINELQTKRQQVLIEIP